MGVLVSIPMYHMHVATCRRQKTVLHSVPVGLEVKPRPTKRVASILNFSVVCLAHRTLISDLKPSCLCLRVLVLQACATTPYTLS